LAAAFAAILFTRAATLWFAVISGLTALHSIDGNTPSKVSEPYEHKKKILTNSRWNPEGSQHNGSTVHHDAKEFRIRFEKNKDLSHDNRLALLYNQHETHGTYIDI